MGGSYTWRFRILKSGHESKLMDAPSLTPEVEHSRKDAPNKNWKLEDEAFSFGGLVSFQGRIIFVSGV